MSDFSMFWPIRRPVSVGVEFHEAAGRAANPVPPALDGRDGFAALKPEHVGQLGLREALCLAELSDLRASHSAASFGTAVQA